MLAAISGFAATTVLTSGSTFAQGVADHDTPASDLRLAEFIGLEDPAHWSVDPATGAAYRRATADERADNAWAVGTFLVQAPELSQMRTGAAEKVRLVLPRADTEAAVVTLRHVGDKLGAPAVVTEVDGETRHLGTPRYAQYVGLLAGEPGESTVVGMLASEIGGVAGYGFDALREVRIRGAETSWTLAGLDDAPPLEELILVTLTVGTPHECVVHVVVSVDSCGEGPSVISPRINACTHVSVIDYRTETCNPAEPFCSTAAAVACGVVCQSVKVVVRVNPCLPGRECDSVKVVARVDVCDEDYREPPTPQCSDGVDNDGDGKTDYPADPGCSSSQDNSEADAVVKPACDDGIDNDGDGKTDYPADPGCSSSEDTSEADPVVKPACDDGLDNDGDGAVDYPADYGCNSRNDDSEINPACSDGLDNDGDQWTDYPKDPGCSSYRDTSETTSRSTRAVGLLGEMKWCTNRSGNWPSILETLGDEFEAGFDANGAVIANPYHAYSTCWTHSSSSNALYCDKYGGCKDSSGHSYPYNACDRWADCYLNNAWNDVSHARQHWSFVGLHNALVMHESVSRRYNSEDGEYNVCGVGKYPPAGNSISTDDMSRCRNYVATHELGHNYYAVHDYGWCQSQENRPGVMAYHDTRGNFFCDSNRQQINACMRSTSYGCPRNGTG